MGCQLIKLSTATIRIYLSDLKNVHKLEDLSTLNFDDFFVTSMIKGAENLSMNNDIAKRSRIAMLFPVRKLIGHECAGSWEPVSRYCANECIFNLGGSGFGMRGLMSKSREMGSSVYKQTETEVDGSCHS